MRQTKGGTYERLSKEDLTRLKTDESMSITGQRMINNSFCKFNNIDIVKDYVDDGYSGSNFDRPGFKEMIEDIENGLINCVITKDLSRLGRELYQTGRYIEDYFIDKGIRYIAINDGYDSWNNDNNDISMKLTFNDYSLRDTSKKVRTALTVRKQNGLYIGSFAKYGYKKDPADHHHLIIDTSVSEVVKRIYNMALQGNSCYKIAQALTDDKIPIPIVHKKEPRSIYVTENNGYGIWKPQTIKSILTSEMYIGNMVQNTYKKVRYNSKKLKKLDKEEYIVVENTHEPIIEKDIFEKVNLIIKSKYRISEKNKDRYLFSGLLFCKECGHKISILEKKNKGNNSHYTQCTQYSKKGRYGICNIHRVNYNLLEEDLISVIKDTCSSFLEEYDNKSLTEEANAILREEQIELQKSIDAILKDISKYNSAIEQLYIDKVEQNISLDLYSNLMEKYTMELKNATKNKEDLEEKKVRLLSKIESLDYDRCAKIVDRFLKTKNITNALISEIVEKVEIDNNKQIQLYFNFSELTSYTR